MKPVMGSSFEVVKIKLLKTFSFIMILIFLLVGCTQENEQNNEQENNDTPTLNNPEERVKEISLKRKTIDFRLASVLPESYQNFIENDAVISDTKVPADYLYMKTPLSQEIYSFIDSSEEIFYELQSVYNELIEQVTFYSDETYKVNNNQELFIDSFEYNGYLILTDIEMITTGKAEDLNLQYYPFSGNYTLSFKRELNENYKQDVTITLIPEDSQYHNNEVRGISIHYSQNSGFSIQYLKLNQQETITSSIELITKDNNYIELKGFFNRMDDLSEESNTFYLYANKYDGIMHNSYVNMNGENVIVESYEDTEVFNSEQQLLYKTLSTAKQNLDNTYQYHHITGWPFNIIDNYQYTNEGTFNEYTLNYNTKTQVINEVGRAGFVEENIDIYKKTNYPVYGYFLSSDKNLPSLYKYVVEIDPSFHQDFSVPIENKLQVMSNVYYLYRWLLLESGVEIDPSERLGIIDTDINKGINNISIKAGYDENQKYQINIEKDSVITDYLYLDGLFYYIADIIYENDHYIAYGQKEGKPFSIIFKVDNTGKITDVFEYEYRRPGIFTTGTYDDTVNEYQFTMELTDGSVHTLSLLEEESMLAIVRKHISLNHSHGSIITPKYIVIHETAVHQPNTDGLYWYNTWNTTVRNASTQFVADDSTVFQLMDINERAWHVGDNRKGEDGLYYSSIFNSNTVGIEITVNDDGDYFAARQNAITLTVFLLKELNLTPDDVVRHKDASGKNCPAYMIANPELWQDFLAQVREAYYSE